MHMRKHIVKIRSRWVRWTHRVIYYVDIDGHRSVPRTRYCLSALSRRWLQCCFVRGYICESCSRARDYNPKTECCYCTGIGVVNLSPPRSNYHSMNTCTGVFVCPGSSHRPAFVARWCTSLVHVCIYIKMKKKFGISHDRPSGKVDTTLRKR